MPIGTCSVLGGDPPGPPVVASASVVTVAPLASAATAAPAVVAIVSVGPALTQQQALRFPTQTLI